MLSLVLWSAVIYLNDNIHGAEAVEGKASRTRPRLGCWGPGSRIVGRGRRRAGTREKKLDLRRPEIFCKTPRWGLACAAVLYLCEVVLHVSYW